MSQSEDIAAWLHSPGLDQYLDAFRTHAIDAGILGELTDADLHEFGGERARASPAAPERFGASRSMINRILKDLSQGGHIEPSRETIELRRGLPKRW